MLKRQYDIELADRKPEVRAYLEKKEFMIIEPSAPYTGAELGSALGGVAKDKTRTMAIATNFPDNLWPEMSRAAVYLHNRTPKYTYNWKSPYDRFHT